jgi:hypothetical protein
MKIQNILVQFYLMFLVCMITCLGGGSNIAGSANRTYIMYYVLCCGRVKVKWKIFHNDGLHNIMKSLGDRFLDDVLA